MYMNGYYPLQELQPSPAQADPQGSTRMSAPFAHHTDSESVPTQYTPYSTGSQTNPSAYNPIQPQTEQLQQIYNIERNSHRQIYPHVSQPATFVSTNVIPTPSRLSPGSLQTPPGMESKPYYCDITNSTNSFEEDGVSHGGPSGTKKRRRQLSPEDREKAKNVRRMGSCARCRIMKLRASLSQLSFPRHLRLPYLSATKKHPVAASAKRYSAKLGLTTSPATVRI